MVKRVAAIHDLAGIGRCSLTVILPVLSAMGIQCCPLPTAVLSTHTGGFGQNTFLELTDQMEGTISHWQQLALPFHGIYSGFMGSMPQLALTEQAIAALKNSTTLVVVDPVMGDHGKIYRTYTSEMCRGMVQLTEMADVITPNLTEAALLLGEPYETLQETIVPRAEEILARLSNNGKRSVVLTGVAKNPQKTGAVALSRESGALVWAEEPRIEGQYPGTGDLFAGVLTGALLQGKSLGDATQQSAEFVRLCVQRTAQQKTPPREGVEFEPLLWKLAEKQEEL